MSGMSVTLEDFERDIADYLWAESERLGQTQVVAFLLAPGPIAEQAQAMLPPLHTPAVPTESRWGRSNLQMHPLAQP